MAGKSRFSIAKQDIIKVFEESDIKVFNHSYISEILQDNRQYWRLTESLTSNKFIELLLRNTSLKKYNLKFKSTVKTLYSWNKVDITDLALGISKKGYLSHYSAVFYHGLTEQIPKSIYINLEQGKKEDRKNSIKQELIDRALKKPAKLTNNYADYRGRRIYLLNGKNTGNLGVDSGDDNIRVTNLERTLIDIAVRPEYSGGIYEVLKSFENASEKVSINKLIAYLKKLNYVYPYHQCIGFYMMATGKYRESQLKLINKIEMTYKFYLTHEMKEKKFSKKWNLYYPANLSI